MQMYGCRGIGRSFSLIRDEFVAFCEEIEESFYPWKEFVPYSEDSTFELQDVDPKEFEDILNGG